MGPVHVHIPCHKVGDYLSFIKEKKLNLEIYFPSSSIDSLTKEDIKRLAESLDYQPSLSLHAPFMDMSPGAIDTKVRDITLERFFQILDVAKILSPRAVVFHSGYEKWRYAHNIDLWLEGSLLTWRPLIEKASEIGVKIAIENIFEDEPSNLRVLMEELGSNTFGICFDTGHCNLFTKVPLLNWIETLNPYIIELHLHDNDKSFDQHLSIGDGTFDFPAFFSALRSDTCIYTIEAHSPEMVMKSLERLKQYVNPER